MHQGSMHGPGVKGLRRQQTMWGETGRCSRDYDWDPGHGTVRPGYRMLSGRTWVVTAAVARHVTLPE